MTTPAVTCLAWSASFECCNGLIQPITFSFQVRNDPFGVQGSGSFLFRCARIIAAPSKGEDQLLIGYLHFQQTILKPRLQFAFLCHRTERLCIEHGEQGGTQVVT